MSPPDPAAWLPLLPARRVYIRVLLQRCRHKLSTRKAELAADGHGAWDEYGFAEAEAKLQVRHVLA